MMCMYVYIHTCVCVCVCVCVCTGFGWSSVPVVRWFSPCSAQVYFCSSTVNFCYPYTQSPEPSTCLYLCLQIHAHAHAHAHAHSHTYRQYKCVCTYVYPSYCIRYDWQPDAHHPKESCTRFRYCASICSLTNFGNTANEILNFT
jgi:hypothetical protein